jgi:hypothetical protein
MQGGTLSFHILQNFFSFDSKCDDTCLNDFNKNFIFELFEKNLFYVKNNKPINNKPILIFFCGLGVKNVKYKLKNFLDYNLHCLNNVMFGMEISNIHDLNQMIEQGYILYERASKMYPDNEFIFLGHSLGSGIAVQTCDVIYKKNLQPRIKGVILLSTYPNLSYTFEKTFFKDFINYSFNNILDNEAAIETLSKKIKKKHFIIIIQGNGDTIFNMKHLQDMVLKQKLNKFVRLEIVKGDHFYPAEIEIWGKYICTL